MADDRERNQGIKQGTGEGGGQRAPGRNPQDDRAAGRQGDQGDDQQQSSTASIPARAETAAVIKKADRTKRPDVKKWCCPHQRPTG